MRHILPYQLANSTVMIKTQGLTTTVKNGQNGKGTISVSSHCPSYGHGVLTLQEIQGKVAIGEKPDDDQVKEMPKINVNFYDEKSIDVYIKALEHIKSNLKKGLSFAMAC